MKARRYLVCAITLLGLAVGAAWAQEGGLQNREGVLFERLRELEQLRADNPEAFRRVVAQKRERLEQAFGQMPPEQREQARRLFAGRQQERRERLENFRSAHPQMFQRLMQARSEQARGFLQKNPERFRTFLANHPRLQNWARQGGVAQGSRAPIGQILRRESERARTSLNGQPRAREDGQRQARPASLTRAGSGAGERPEARGPQGGRRRGGGR